ncbi:MAG: 5'/3'-nucleotidase SurE [Planctomycetales bacterium]|nr:5'/3'-nucleotidase SurE [Planctomycetales bacterium]
MPAPSPTAPLLLVTNDDGVESVGLAALAGALRPLGQVVVVAPTTERSGVSHALTIWDPVRVRPTQLADGRPATAVEGTPADCVKIAVLSMLPRRPAAVLAGVNRGLNVGVNLFYSGTVGAALEAAILGIPAAAISLDAKKPPLDFAPAAAVGARVASALLGGLVPGGTILNVNVPPLPAGQLKGVRLTTQSPAAWEERYEVAPDPAAPDQGRIYRMTGTLRREGWGEDSDIEALRQGCVSVTPLRAAFVSPDGALDAAAVLRALGV